jgi:glycosyltransferase involved in cell wall biosynthesis
VGSELTRATDGPAARPRTPIPGKRILILVENLPVPPDRRVWQEACALRDAGFTVSVICPQGKGWTAPREIIDGILVLRHHLPEARGRLGYVREYATAIAAQTALAWRLFVEEGFDVVQACNPPDLLFLVALQFRPFGVRFVFDHHDLAVELFRVKFARSRLLLPLVRLCETATLRLADAIISPNEIFQAIDMRVGRKTPDRATIVLSAPDLGAQLQVGPDPALKAGRRFMALYVGVMGSQDGVDILLEAAAHLRHVHARTDIQFVLAGDGPERPTLEALATTLGIAEHVTFLGFVTGDALWRALRTADAGLCPDPRNEFNDKLTMNKLLEYMAFGVPSLAFDLAMSRRLIGPAGTVVTEDGADAFADALAGLLDDPARRAAMSDAATRRFAEHYSWSRQAEALVGAYERVTAPRKPSPIPGPEPAPEPEPSFA